MPKVSVIVPVKKVNHYITTDLIPGLTQQFFTNFELIIISDIKEKTANFPNWVKIISSWPKTGPAEKRDIGVNLAKGEIIAFIDDDAYPNKNWLKHALPYFNNPLIAAVAGPGITPPSNTLNQKVSGYVWSTWLGAGGAGVYRNKPMAKREVDDYPTFNLMVLKKDYLAVGGFDTHFWPGEDTKLCHDLVYKLAKKIIYDPNVLVYHHRRPVFIAHLNQIARFAVHRGHFARILPKTSLRLSYFIPSLFVLLLLLTFPVIFLLELFSLCFISISLYLFFAATIFVYLLLLIATAIITAIKEKDWRIGALLIPAIFTTHLLYGVLFIKGLVSSRLIR